MRAVSEVVCADPTLPVTQSACIPLSCPSDPLGHSLASRFLFHLPFDVFELVGTQGLGVAVQVFRSLRSWHIRHVEGLQRVRVL